MVRGVGEREISGESKSPPFKGRREMQSWWGASFWVFERTLSDRDSLDCGGGSESYAWEFFVVISVYLVTSLIVETIGNHSCRAYIGWCYSSLGNAPESCILKSRSKFFRFTNNTEELNMQYHAVSSFLQFFPATNRKYLSITSSNC